MLGKRKETERGKGLHGSCCDVFAILKLLGGCGLRDRSTPKSESSSNSRFFYDELSLVNEPSCLDAMGLDHHRCSDKER